MRKNDLRGFTLIEMIVVMAVIAVLASLVLGNLLKSQKRSYDAQRQGDIKTLQNAFEQYYAVNGDYPGNDTEAGGEFPSGLPTDPRNKGSFVYTITYGGGSSYCACALLEVITGNATNATCSYGSGNYFCTSNLQ